jgi:putative heme iron utilization protein
MSKTRFNGFENYFITNALKHAIIQAEDDILELEREGKSSIFASGYFNMIGEDLLQKIDHMTLKKDMNAKNQYKQNTNEH